MKFSANFKTSLNNGAKLNFGAKVVRKTKEKEIDFYEDVYKRQGSNKTSQSAHAALKGSVWRPQLPKDGKAAEWELQNKIKLL